MSKRKIDYVFKAHILKEYSELLDKQRKASLYSYSLDLFNEYGIINHSLKNDNLRFTTSDLYNECKEKGIVKEFLECVKINHASYKRTKRLKDRVSNILLSGDCLFLTLTFNDNALETYSYIERRKAVSRFLKTSNSQYVANIDYGKKNHREHYHAVVGCSSIVLDNWRKYGNINVERVRNRDIDKDKVRLAKYICKLSNHAIKETTNRSALIYSR